MLYVIRKADGRPDPYSAGTRVEADGRIVRLRQPDFTIDVLERWVSPRNHGTYPMKWRLRAPTIGLDVTVSLLFPTKSLTPPRARRSSTGKALCGQRERSPLVRDRQRLRRDDRLRRPLPQAPVARMILGFSLLTNYTYYSTPRENARLSSRALVQDPEPARLIPS